jgi:hypothetical protein
MSPHWSVVAPPQTTLHIPAEHCAIPVPESGPGHTFVHEPQCNGSVISSTQVPLQLVMPPSQCTTTSAPVSFVPVSPSRPESPPLLLPLPLPLLLPLSVPLLLPLPLPLLLPLSVTTTSAPWPSPPPSSPPPHELVSLHVPPTSVPQAVAHAAMPATPTQSPTVTK